MTPEQLTASVRSLEERLRGVATIREELARLDAKLRRNEPNTKKIIREYLARKQDAIRMDESALDHRKWQLESDRALYERIKEEDRQVLERDRARFERIKEQDRQALEALFAEKSRGFPWLVSAVGDYLALRDDQWAHYLETKSPPAVKAAERVRAIGAERRQYARQARTARYLLDYYESLFPWLVDFRGDDLDDLTRYVFEGGDNQAEKYIRKDPARRWLSDEEYESLVTTEKYQLALDRYWRRKKRPWEIGRDYERYIGYLFEVDGYQVRYEGIVKGFRDLGRDLICTKDDHVEIVQW